MTGAPRRATVIASTDVETYRLDKEGFQAIIEQRPELADSLSGILERRLQRFAELEQGYSAGQNELAGKPVPKKTLDNIRSQHEQLRHQQALLAEQLVERGAMDEELAAALARYQALKDPTTEG